MGFNYGTWASILWVGAGSILVVGLILRGLGHRQAQREARKLFRTLRGRS